MYAGTGNNEATAITSTPDGNFIVTGSSSPFGSVNSHDIYLLKIKPNGDTLWTKTYGGNSDNVAYAITPTPDGNFIVAGRSSSFGAGNYDVYLLKIKPDGDTLWTKTYGGNDFEEADAITPTPDGNFIIAGRTYFFNAGSDDVYLLKINPNGDMLWTKTYGGTDWDDAYAITPTSDGNFIVAGYTSSFGAGDVYLLKIKSNGDTIWTKTYGGTDWDEAYTITPTPDGNFIVAGYTYSGNWDIYIVKIKPNGDTLWTKTYGGIGNDCAHIITPTPDGNFIIAGGTSSFGVGNDDVYILKIKPNGDTLWTKTYGGTGDDEAFSIAQTSDGNFIVAGNSGGGVFLLSIINDRYAYKNSLFTFKIPVSGDSLNHGYAPLKVPAGMTVSLGGTISWTPATDSVYMDHVEFLVFDDFGNKDTLTFNIFVNSSYHPTAIKPVSRFITNKSQAFGISQTSSSKIKFNVPSGALSLDIYDIRGRQVQHIVPSGTIALWNKTNASGTPVPAGKYVAKMVTGKSSRVQEFMVVR
jgi:hypothetical protein